MSYDPDADAAKIAHLAESVRLPGAKLAGEWTEELHPRDHGKFAVKEAIDAGHAAADRLIGGAYDALNNSPGAEGGKAYDAARQQLDDLQTVKDALSAASTVTAPPTGDIATSHRDLTTAHNGDIAAADHNVTLKDLGDNRYGILMHRQPIGTVEPAVDPEAKPGDPIMWKASEAGGRSPHDGLGGVPANVNTDRYVAAMRFTRDWNKNFDAKMRVGQQAFRNSGIDPTA